MAKLCLIRHGQSQWNLENRFTGWVDVPLSEKGVEEARLAGDRLKAKNIAWDECHTSRLLRAQKTLQIILEKLEQSSLPRWEDSALNERFYGELQGMNKDEARQKFGEEQVHIWRRSYDSPPPGGESLLDTSKRTLPYFNEYILKKCQEGKNILVAAHGNSLRSIIMQLQKMSADEILKFEIATGVPYLYDIDSAGNIAGPEVLSS